MQSWVECFTVEENQKKKPKDKANSTGEVKRQKVMDETETATRLIKGGKKENEESRDRKFGVLRE